MPRYVILRHDVPAGYERRLEIQGVGYRAQLKGSNLELAVGYSHPVPIAAPQGIEFEVPQPTRVIVKGIDKELVGQVEEERNLALTGNVGGDLKEIHAAAGKNGGCQELGFSAIRCGCALQLHNVFSAYLRDGWGLCGSFLLCGGSRFAACDGE